MNYQEYLRAMHKAETNKEETQELTNQEYKPAYEYYRNLAISQRILIDKYEHREINLINQCFYLAKEVDQLTESAFLSPYLHKKEVSV